MFALMMNKELYRGYLQQLQQIYNSNEAAVITDWVFEKVAGLQRFDIIKNPDQTLPVEITEELKHCLTALLHHKPVQYVLGEAWFCRMKLIVNEQVLIPRPETEKLVQLVVDNRQMQIGKGQSAIGSSRFSTGKEILSYPFSILDIGTGSGCIAIAVKKKLPGTSVHAIDISPGALSIAKKNAVTQEVDVEFLQLDFLDESGWEKLPVFDAIISNPPYIPLHEKDALDKNVTAYEPHSALFVPDNAPLLFYEKIAAFGKNHLRENGTIYVEFHEDFAKETKEVFAPFYNTEIKKDLFGKERMLVAVKSPA